jgi:hypothetical protein
MVISHIHVFFCCFRVKPRTSVTLTLGGIKSAKPSGFMRVCSTFFGHLMRCCVCKELGGIFHALKLSKSGTLRLYTIKLTYNRDSV